MKLVPLTQGKFAKVDNEDWIRVSQYNWHFNAKYAKRKVLREETGGLVKRQGMHRFIMGIDDPSVLVDHINNDTLDNRKQNLRLCGHTQNCFNRKPRSKIGLKGVNLDGSRYRARIQGTSLGNFRTAKEAAMAYNKAALKLYGRFAWLNYIAEDHYEKPKKKKT
jgi:hypothetical protein